MRQATLTESGAPGRVIGLTNFHTSIQGIFIFLVLSFVCVWLLLYPRML